MDVELGRAHKNAYVASFVAHGVLSRSIDAKMQSAGVVGLDVYEVLLVLEEAPHHRLRMSELADRMLVSRSGSTRLVDRLERQGLLRREACPMDRRSCHAALTPLGLEARHQAWPVYEAAIASQFASLLSEDEAEIVAAVFRRMVEADRLVGFNE